MKKYKIIAIALTLFAIFACESQDTIQEKSVIFVPEQHKSDFDKWIYKTFTKPYNVEIKWKWDDGEVTSRFHVSPPRKEKAEQFLKAFYNVWIKPYEEVGGSDFIKTYIPKLIFLVGTAQYNNDGTKTLGLAEGGRKVTIFEVNEFDNTNIQKMAKSFHTLHHEFAHILHQKILYPVDYKLLSKGSYTGSWFNVKLAKANTLGFISPYSMLNTHEDFVETAATILSVVRHSNTPVEKNVPEKDPYGVVTGNIVKKKLSDFQMKLYMFGIQMKQQSNGKIKLVQDKNAPVGLNIMLKKVNIVKEYYSTEWGIDIFKLQGKIEQAIAKYISEN